MASIYNRGTRAKPNFWIGWVDRTGRHRGQKIGPDRELAKAVAAKIEADIRQVLAVPEFVARMSNAGLDLFVYSSPQMITLVRGDLDKFSGAITLANIKPE